MKKTLVLLLCLLLTFVTAGCNDKVNIEDITMALILGVDLNDQGEVEMYISSPVFSEEAKEKSENFKVKTVSIREARNYYDTMATGITAGGKLQTILIGHKVLEESEWTSIFDLLFRDAKTRLNAHVAIVNGSVKDIINFSPKDKPRISIFIPQLIDTANLRNVAFRTTLRSFNQQVLDKGITPFLPELTFNKNVQITGTVLLKDNNVYKRTLPLYETQLLKILNGNINGQLSLTIPVDMKQKGTKTFPKNRASFFVQKVEKKVKKHFKNGKYQFNVNLEIPVEITESPIKLTGKNTGKLEKKIEENLQNDLNDFVNSLRKDKVDPVGFGILARSFKYDQWKKVDNNWVNAFQKADIKIKVKLIITDRGNIL